VKNKWLRFFAILAFVLGATIVVVFLIFETGIAERWVRKTVVEQLELRTGARVELGGFHLHLFRLHAELDNLTLHGLEPASGKPLFHADRISLGITILSFFGREFKVDEVLAERPELFVRFAKNGASNIPTPKIAASQHPWQQTLFNLKIGRLELRDGSADINDQRIPLDVQGQNLAFLLQYVAPGPNDHAYVGNIRWDQFNIALAKDLPFRSSLAVKFTLHPDAFELNELVWKLPHSELNLRAELPTFSKTDWTVHYRGRLSLEDTRAIFRSPLTPDLTADFSGDARDNAGVWTGSGHFDGHDVKMPYQWFHATGLEAWGNFTISREKLVVENLAIRALEGSLDGRLDVDLKTLAFRTQTHFHHGSLADALAAVANDSFPVKTLHWDGGIDIDSTNTWVANFKHFRTAGESRWSPPATTVPGVIPVTARIVFDYSEDSQVFAISHSEITTPDTQIDFDGSLAAGDGALEISLKAGDLTEWDDLINTIRGKNAVPTLTAGALTFQGRILGPLGGPTFSGHAHVTDARYDTYSWDEIDGTIDYSPDDFRLSNAAVKRGDAKVALEVALNLDHDWGFGPGTTWTVEAQTRHAPSRDVQSMFGVNYPVSADLSGVFHGSGTSDAPVLDADFTLVDILAKGFRFDRLTGRLHLANDEMRLSNAELTRDAGTVSGDVLYRPQEKTVEFHVAGTGIPLEKIKELQNSSLAFAGQLDFDVRGSGPVRSPSGQGDFRVVNLKIGGDDQGDFRGRLTSDGENARLALNSERSNGQLRGQLNLGLSGDEPISGKLSVMKFDLDPLLTNGLHLKNLTTHSMVDGDFTLSGALRKPETIEMNADISHITFGYLFISLENAGPVQFAYRHNEVRIAQARFQGTDTNFEVNGSARFDRDRPIHLNLVGEVNLGLVKGILPDLTAQGKADVNVDAQGTMSRPRITGRVTVRDASANYSDFPVGLSHLNGDLVFDRSRLLFESVTAQSGGGQLNLGGSVTYGEDGPVRYEITVSTPQVRIRYPQGMSWLMGGTLQLAGTSDRAVLSGNLELKRLLFAEGSDITSFFSGGSSAAGASSSSAFMRNLTFDVEAHSSPGARIEWTSAQVEIDSDLHLRGTWDRPIILGHIHLLGGQMSFRGNNFTLTRGDINFANPFQLDPELNIEATSTISQYAVTINFSGRASKLSLSYRSDPPLPDTDIIALLALGTTGQESALRSASGSNGPSQGASALLSEAVSTGLGGRIERLFGISHFRVDPFLAGTATESSASARVTIEQQVTRDLTVTYSSNAASDQQQLIQVEYHVRRDMSIVFLRDINGTYGLDIKFVKHFH
jgi:translocation and assembly module TamB